MFLKHFVIKNNETDFDPVKYVTNKTKAMIAFVWLHQKSPILKEKKLRNGKL